MGTPRGAAASPGRWAQAAGGLPSTSWYPWAGSLVNRLGSAVGPFLALCLTGSRGVSTAAPLLGTQVLQRSGEAALWAGCAVLGAVSAGGLLRVSGAARSRETAAV